MLSSQQGASRATFLDSDIMNIQDIDDQQDTVANSRRASAQVPAEEQAILDFIGTAIHEHTSPPAALAGGPDIVSA